MTMNIDDIKVTMIEDSISVHDERLQTMQLFYPRMIHSEFMTHRQHSKNASSSRAIPVKTLLSMTRQQMYIPKFRKNQPGMQPGDYLSESEQRTAEAIWSDMAEYCMRGVELLAEMGVHKQWANRPTEWFGWINVLCTSSTFTNFNALRMELTEAELPMAQDEIYTLARKMWEVSRTSKPKLVLHGDWHLPYVHQIERDSLPLGTLQKISVARCAGVSYKPFTGTGDLDKELERYDKLMARHPIHASPAEHVATPDTRFSDFTPHGETPKYTWANPHLHGNLKGWVQFRKLLPNENITEYEG